MFFQGRLNVSVRLTDSVRPSDRCLSVRQISVCPTDVRLSNRFAMGFAMGFYTSFPLKGEGKAPEGGHFTSMFNLFKTKQKVCQNLVR